jgi:hypothetical protein
MPKIHDDKHVSFQDFFFPVIRVDFYNVAHAYPAFCACNILFAFKSFKLYNDAAIRLIIKW